MKQVFLTDVTTNLNKLLLEQENIIEINNSKSLLGQIIYTMDLMLNSNLDIIYFTNKENFNTLISLANKVTKIHSNSQILIIDITSDLIGKNNLVLRLCKDKHYEKIINKYNLHSELVFDYADAYEERLAISSL